MVPDPSRREFLQWSSAGLGATAAMALLLQDGVLKAEAIPSDAGDPPPHFTPKARRVIQVFCCGGLSQVDSFDYKPALARYHAQPMPTSEKPDVFFGQVGLLRKNDWDFRQHGQAGTWISDLFPHLGSVADELAIIRSMTAETSNHTPATFQSNTGFRLNGFPTLGAWTSFGLGNECDDLPAYVVIPDPRGLPAGGSINWSNGFLPARHQGVTIRSRGTPISDLTPAEPIAASTEFASRELLATLNQRHQAERGGSDVLAARMRAYELAARMQLAVPQVADLDQETAETQALYGLDQPETSDFGRSCLLTRRLLEKGVRFVQLFSGGAFGSPRINWDAHENMIERHGTEARRIDRPLAGLIKDLRRRGMLDDTLIVFTSEFGRTPFTQSAEKVLGLGRDHNQNGFSVWLAGGGAKGGTSYGNTDEFGYKSVENVVTWYDFHATILHLMGIDHERLTYYHNGIQRRLTNVHGHVIRDVLA